MDRALFPFWETGKTQEVCGNSTLGPEVGGGGGTHVGELVGRRSVVQQQVDDVCVALLGSLMEGGVTVLGGGTPVGIRRPRPEVAKAHVAVLPLSSR